MKSIQNGDTTGLIFVSTIIQILLRGFVGDQNTGMFKYMTPCLELVVVKIDHISGDVGIGQIVKIMVSI